VSVDFVRAEGGGDLVDTDLVDRRCVAPDAQHARLLNELFMQATVCPCTVSHLPATTLSRGLWPMMRRVWRYRALRVPREAVAGTRYVSMRDLGHHQHFTPR
jgi:hypothetical protein